MQSTRHQEATMKTTATHLYPKAITATPSRSISSSFTPALSLVAVGTS